MGGTIEIESQLGHGTTVSVTLRMPLAEANPALVAGASERAKPGAPVGPRRPAPSVAQAQQEGTLVLVVDDHPINRMVLMRQVTVLGYAAETASDGREALALWRSGRFGLVITDCNMPEMDGYELARAIRAQEQGSGERRTIIVACTANALKGEAQNCFDAGMNDYVAKPVELEALAAKLDAWLPLPGQGRTAAASDAQATPADGIAAPVMDSNVLGELSEGDPAKAREIVALFMPYNDEDVSSMHRAMASRNMADIARIAHRIRGATRSIGALALAQVCEAVEAAARMRDWSAIATQQAAFGREAARLNEHLRAMGRST
jgi:CheY-like chemotaxis protein/HPt (histidine-containing phosphotransfer) domain-containing protein